VYLNMYTHFPALPYTRHIHFSPYSYVCFVFYPIFINIFWFSFFLFYKFNRHLCHGAYWSTHNHAHILILLRFHFCTSCVRVCQLVYAFPSSSIFIHIYRNIYMYICFDYHSVMTRYILYTPIMIRLCVPAPRGWARCCHNCDSIFNGLCINIHPSLCFLWIQTYHVYIKNVQFSREENKRNIGRPKVN